MKPATLPLSAVMAVSFASLIHAESIDTRFGKIDLLMGLPANAQEESVWCVIAPRRATATRP